MSFYRPYDEKKKEAAVHSHTWNTEIPNDQTLRDKIIKSIEGDGEVSDFFLIFNMFQFMIG